MLDRVSPDYLKMQNEVTNNHRTILVDWMCDVGIKFKLLTETMFLAVYIMDKYLSLKEVPRSKFQLLGTTSILIASKFEEIYTPEVKDFVWVSGQAYNAEEFLKMERTILSTLDFNVSTPIPLHFLRRFSKAAKSDAKLHTLSKYIIELSLLEYSLLKYKPSEIAAAAVYITRKMTNITPTWVKKKKTKQKQKSKILFII